MNIKQFYDYDHARQWLSKSLIRVNGRPVYISLVEHCKFDSSLAHDVYRIVSTDISDGSHLITWYPWPSVDLNPVPLGMININKYKDRSRVYFVSRSPLRQWQIGLTSNNMILSQINISLKDNFYSMNYMDILRSKDLVDTIMGHYPSYDKSLFKVARKKGQEGNMVAFSRDFALADKNKLYYKTLGEPVGEAQPSGPVLYDEFEYLQPALKEDLS